MQVISVSCTGKPRITRTENPKVQSLIPRRPFQADSRSTTGLQARTREAASDITKWTLSSRPRKAKAGLLVLVDRKSRRYVIELINHITQEDVVKAIKRMISRKALGRIRSISTDNGCEFLNPEKIKDVIGCNVYYTRAYAS